MRRSNALNAQREALEVTLRRSKNFVLRRSEALFKPELDFLIALRRSSFLFCGAELGGEI
jgi:hypothetical protein